MLKKVTLLFLLTSYFVQGQIIDTNEIGFVTSNNSTLQHFDTTLSLESYLDFNDYFKDDFSIISLGNQGDVRRRLSFHSTMELNPNLGIDGYFKNDLKVGDVPFYNVKVTTGAFRFLNGYQKGQMFNGFITLNPIARLNVYLSYERINSRGRYFNQENTADHLHLSTRYSTKQDAYRITGALSWNKFNNIEYGGIVNDSDFATNKYSNRELVDVNLLNSFSKLSTAESSIEQSLRVVNLDSITEIRAFYNFSLKNQYATFRSTDSAFTQNAIFDLGEIRDSIRIQSLRNVIGIALNMGKQLLKAGISQSYYIYGNKYALQRENIYGLDLSVSGLIKRFGYDFRFQNQVNGAYAGSYNVNAALNYGPNKNTKFVISASHGLANAGLFTQQYISNNFVWLNSFKQIMQTRVNGSFDYKRYGIQFGVSHLNNYVYFNQQAIPEQLDGGLIAYNIDLNARIKILKGVFLDNKIRYHGSDNEEVIRIPDWVLRSILFYEVSTFKNALNMHFGIEFNYFSSFTSRTFLPATTVMYLQDQVNIGNFPYFNFFADFKIKDFVFFVRLENITQGLFDYNYYAAPSYPLPDFAFRFGATWRFFN